MNKSIFYNKITQLSCKKEDIFVKKAICILVSAFLIIAIFIGCGGNSVTPAPAESPAAQSAPAESPAAAEPAPAEKTTINLTSWYRFDSFYTSSLQEALARELPHIELNYEVIPADQYNQVLTTRVLAGAEQAPDIIQVDVGQMFAQFANDGILTDLSNEEFISSYTDVTKAALTHNGKAYGICLEGNGAGFFYNKDVFNAVGVQPPSTFAELLDVCEKIAAAGIAPVGFSGKDAWTLKTFLNLVNGLKTFELPFVLTNGGPGYATETVGTVIYELGFRQGKMGYASAISVVFFSVIAVVSILQLKLTRSREVEL